MSNRIMLQKRVVNGFAIFLASCFSAVPFSASADGVRYPASMCKQFAGPGTILSFSSVIAPELPQKSQPKHNNNNCPPPQAGGCPPCAEVSACRNDPAFSAKLDCPIPKSFPDRGTLDVTVDVIDRHKELNVECFLTSVVWDAAINAFQEKSTKLKTVDSGNHIQPLRFPPHESAGSAAHWYVSCSLPAGSQLVSYYVREKTTLPGPGDLKTLTE